MSGAYKIIKEHNFLPSICGRICSAPCEAACVLNEEKAPIGIRALERYASEFGRSKAAKESLSKGKKVAIVGSGPSGLAAAEGLVRKKFQVTIFESLDKPGGILRYGIPEFRIPKKILDQELDELKGLGVEIKTNFFIGRTLTLDELKQQGYAATLLAMGAGVPKLMDIPGTHLGGVYYGEELLMRVNLIKSNLFSKYSLNFGLGRKVVVIGSGNTALDCARSAVRFGREAMVIFRRTEEEMRVHHEERKLASQEGIRFEPLVKPVEILGDQKHLVNGLKCVRMDYADTETPGTWQLIPVPDSEFIIETDTIVIAVGHRPNTISGDIFPDLKLNQDGTICVDPATGMTSRPGVFACGNVVTNAGPVVEAIASGKKAAEYIGRFLQ